MFQSSFAIYKDKSIYLSIYQYRHKDDHSDKSKIEGITYRMYDTDRHTLILE